MQLIHSMKFTTKLLTILRMKILQSPVLILIFQIMEEISGTSTIDLVKILEAVSNSKIVSFKRMDGKSIGLLYIELVKEYGYLSNTSKERETFGSSLAMVENLTLISDFSQFKLQKTLVLLKLTPQNEQ